MKASAILFYKLKYSLIIFVIVFSVTFSILFFLPSLLGVTQTILSNWTIGALFTLLIRGIDYGTRWLSFQFNVSRKLNFLMGIFNMIILAVVTLISVTLMNEFLKASFDSIFLSTGPQLDYVPFHFRSSYFNFLVYQFKSFVTLMLCGSLALLMTQFLIRHPQKKFIHFITWFIPISIMNSTFIIPYLGWIEHPIIMIGILLIGTLVILKVTYNMVQKVNVSNHSKGGFLG